MCRENGVEWVKLANGTELKFHVAAFQGMRPLEVPRPAASGKRVGQNDTQDADLSEEALSRLSPLDRQVLEDARMEGLLLDDSEAFEDLQIEASLRRQEAVTNAARQPTPAN